MAKKKVINEEKTSDELKEEFFDAKEDKESIVGKIFSILLWIVLLAWIAVCVVDYFKTLDDKKPMFTFSHNTVKYEDGSVTCYTGAGYKVYHYNRKCYTGRQFGPFWTKDKSVESETCKK